MSLIKAHGDSNAPKGEGSRPENNAQGEDLGMKGYTVVAFASQKPARSNADISITGDFDFKKVNEGTSFPSYDEQSETVSAESGS